MDTLERVRKIAAEKMGVSEDQVTPQASLKNDFAADSLTMMEIIMELEEAFCMEFGEEALELGTAQQFADYVETKWRNEK